VERSARVAILRAMDIGLGGNGNGHALEQHWPEQEYSLYPTLKNTFINWFLACQEAQEDSCRDTIINNLAEMIKHKSIRLVNIGGKGPAISYRAAHCMATDLFSEDHMSAEDCRDLAREHTPFDRKSISTDPVTGRMQHIKKKGFLAGALQNIKLNPPHATANV
jgi:hypothetical protein